MSGSAVVDEAAYWATRLTQAEARGPGDMQNAWRRLSVRHDVPWRVFWQLRYRKPRDLTVSIYRRLAAAYRAECERQMRQLQHEIEITKAIAGADHPAVAAALALVGEEGERVGGVE